MGTGCEDKNLMTKGGGLLSAWGHPIQSSEFHDWQHISWETISGGHLKGNQQKKNSIHTFFFLNQAHNHGKMVEVRTFQIDNVLVEEKNAYKDRIPIRFQRRKSECTDSNLALNSSKIVLVEVWDIWFLSLVVYFSLSFISQKWALACMYFNIQYSFDVVEG